MSSLCIIMFTVTIFKKSQHPICIIMLFSQFCIKKSKKNPKIFLRIYLLPKYCFMSPPWIWLWNQRNGKMLRQFFIYLFCGRDEKDVGHNEIKKKFVGNFKIRQFSITAPLLVIFFVLTSVFHTFGKFWDSLFLQKVKIFSFFCRTGDFSLISFWIAN